MINVSSLNAHFQFMHELNNHLIFYIIAHYEYTIHGVFFLVKMGIKKFTATHTG